MPCTYRCNQGRACDCAPADTLSERIRYDIDHEFAACYREFRKGRGRWCSFWRAVWAVWL